MIQLKEFLHTKTSSKRFMIPSILTRVFFLILITLPLLSNAQFEVEDLVTVPKTPEAAAFTEYANTASVSLYTGKASVSVPIDGLQGRNMSYPVSLTYMTGGIKVQQEAGIAGLGWNLNVGGMVTRNVNGLPDDYISADDYYFPFYSEQPYQWSGAGTPPIFDVYKQFRDQDHGVYFSGAQVGATYEGSYQDYSPGGWHEMYRDFIRRVNNVRNIEITPDSYSFSAGGISGTMVIDYEDGSAYCIEHPDYKVEVVFGTTGGSGQKPINEWRITDNQGTIYHFDEIESTTVKGSDTGYKNSVNGRKYASAWYLSSIYNPHAKDTYTFDYTTYTTAEYSMIKRGTQIGDRYLQGDDSDQYCGSGSGLNDPGFIEYQYEKQRLHEVRVNNTSRLVLFYDANRLDLSTEDMLDGIEVYDVLGGLLNEFDFTYSYFGTPDVSSTRKDYISRLRLDEVLILGDANSTEELKYVFDYDGQSMPDRDSFAQDFWGFYNGADDNLGLVPRNNLLTDYVNYTGNREVNGSSMQAGVLKTVQYPTGGGSSFQYASNGYAAPSTTGFLESVGAFVMAGGSDPQANDPCDPQAGITGAPDVIFDAMVIEETDVYTVTISGGVSGSVQGVALRRTTFDQCEATQPSDPDSFAFLELNPDNFGTTTVTLEPGKYHVMMINDNAGSTLTFSVTRYVNENQIITKPAGGLRVVAKENFDENGALANRTIYQYRNATLDGAHNSGELHHLPSFEIVNRSEGIHQNLPVACESVARFASNQSTPTPNIVTYGTVSEIDVDLLGSANGVTVFDFYNENEGVGTRPFVKSKLKNGMVHTKKVFKVNDEQEYELILREENDYHIEPLGGMVGYSFESQASAYLDPMIHENPENPDEAKWVYAPMYITSLGLSGGANYSQLITTSVQTYTSFGAFSISGAGIATADVSTVIESDANVETALAPCSFDHNSNYDGPIEESDILNDLVDAVNTVDPQTAAALEIVFAANDFIIDLFNSSDETEYYWEENPLLIECFPQPNQIPIVYKQPYLIPRSWLKQVSTTTYQYENGAEISTTRTYTYDPKENKQFQVRSVDSEYPHGKTESLHYYYALDNPSEFTGLQELVNQNRVAEPFEIVRSVDGLEKSIKRTLYDNQGRPLKIQVAHDSPEIALGTLDSYLEDRIKILAYDGHNNITKIRGADGLLKHFVWGYNGYLMIAQFVGEEEDLIRNAIIVNIPDDDGGYAYGEAAHSLFRDIPGTLVSTFSFDPGKGVTRQTDPNGRNTYYEYDSFGRLLKVIDHEGHVLSQNEYHIINN